MGRLLATYLSKFIKNGSLTVHYPDGKSESYGDGTGSHVAMELTDKAAERALVLDPALKAGELFMDGRLRITDGSIYDFLALISSNTQGLPITWSWHVLNKLRILTRRIHQHNTLRRSKSNVARHYDLDGTLYRLFLDSDRQYSCGYFEHPDDNLENAQLAKKRHIAAKMCIEDGMDVLDIGCGWGGMGLYLADLCGANVTGLTLSEEQHGIANGRAVDSGLTDRARFRLQDYRDCRGQFDRIVSVGMFEHVGVGNYPTFFDAAHRLLKPDGVMLLHSIGRFDGPGATNPWVDKYIFPGGYIPSLSEVLPKIEKAGLKVTDIEILRLHYAETLKAWRDRFLARRDEAKALYDERFCLMWEFYLAASETAFRYQDMMVFQIQITRDQEAVPLTRDYILEAEQRLRERERKVPHLRLAGE
ncbi:cyclopropane-fatty-acyl-phospholipid synthase [Breoghania corrubedonensis]|uniref:Cyclopropane-fatty-acyl-phospholipid synthase n=1 Tax=Breoghania corrubedonensis TaxID=665038 RepID=A0A2T5V9N3_9HYPH|nr:cyclopropane-fatty-acyl-phospholipid synthase family protein [Breoghania corrubedonensis]PTW60450.1 cyclopropane-fatty-acyl-phospholipid synthase [Breoghania corrubedonensis]